MQECAHLHEVAGLVAQESDFIENDSYDVFLSVNAGHHTTHLIPLLSTIEENLAVKRRERDCSRGCIAGLEEGMCEAGPEADVEAGPWKQSVSWRMHGALIRHTMCDAWCILYGAVYGAASSGVAGAHRHGAAENLLGLSGMREVG